jgi:hypothetical protein
MINFNEVVPSADQETRDFINQFNGFEIEKADRKSVTFTNGIKVSYSLDVSDMGLGSYVKNPTNALALPIQVVVRVTIDGVYATSFGCMSDDDNALCLLWFQQQAQLGYVAEKLAKSNAEAKYKRLINGVEPRSLKRG